MQQLVLLAQPDSTAAAIIDLSEWKCLWVQDHPKFRVSVTQGHIMHLERLLVGPPKLSSLPPLRPPLQQTQIVMAEHILTHSQQWAPPGLSTQAESDRHDNILHDDGARELAFRRSRRWSCVSELSMTIFETALASSSANVLVGNSANDLCSVRRVVRLKMRCSMPTPLPDFDACVSTSCWKPALCRHNLARQESASNTSDCHCLSA